MAFAAGVGLWIGSKWGWWLAAFYFMFNVVRHAFSLVLVMVLVAQDLLPDRDVESDLFKYGFGIVFGLLLFAYCFKANVLQFFGLTAISKAKAIAILAAVSIALSGAVFTIAVLAGYSSS